MFDDISNNYVSMQLRYQVQSRLNVFINAL